jgi:hypothetical protein
MLSSPRSIHEPCAARYAGAGAIRARLAAKKMAAEAQMPADRIASARCSNPECRHIRPKAVARP